MDTVRGQSRLLLASVGAATGIGAALVTGVAGFGRPWQEAIGPALGSGIGLAVAFSLVLPRVSDRGR